MASTIPRRPGRPSRQDRIIAVRRMKPVTRPAEGVSFHLLRSADQPADVEHFWARQAFYDALRAYAPAALDELAQIAQATRAAEPFPFTLHLELRAWCGRYTFWAIPTPERSDEHEPDHDQGNGDRLPVWLRRDATDSYATSTWDWQSGDPFRLRAFYRGGAKPEIDPRLPMLDSVECRVLLRFNWVQSEVDETGARVPFVASKSAVITELVDRFRNLAELEFDALLNAAASRGLSKPSAARLETAMRRYVLKQFRWLDSLDIAAAETRGDSSVAVEPTDDEREAMRDEKYGRTRRRDVDDDIKFAADLLGVPARSFPPGRKPSRSLSERRP